jgi:hypothetical protein
MPPIVHWFKCKPLAPIALPLLEFEIFLLFRASLPKLHFQMMLIARAATASACAVCHSG